MKDRSTFSSRIEHGLIPAVPVPFRVDGRVDEAAQERYVAYMAAQPIAGVAVWAHTGRGLRLSGEQRNAVLRSWRSGLGPDKVIVAGVGVPPGGSTDPGAYIDSAVAIAESALGGRADALLVHPPSLFGGKNSNEDIIFKYHERLASLRVPLIVFYLYEAAGGISYSVDLLRRIMSLPEVAGIKLATLDSLMTYQTVAKLLNGEFPGKTLITGEDRFLGYSLMCGAKAALIGMGSACTQLQADLLRSYFAGKGEEFLQLSERVDRLSQVLFIPPMEGYIRRMLWTLVHLGVLSIESAHDPWGPELPQSEFVNIGKTLRALGEIGD
jgi:4-hydroxy-tetrahydrodipicolinate synthase